MTDIIDRRADAGRGSTSRQRFLDRHKKNIKRAVDKAISGGNVTDIGKGGVDVTIPPEDINEPTFHHGNGGTRQRVLPGNKEYRAGDRAKRPQGGGGQGKGQASDSGEGEDDFVFHISEEEFRKFFYEDLELPNMKKVGETDSKKTRLKRSGMSSHGSDDKRDFPRSKRKRMGRILSAERPHKDRIIELLGEEKDILLSYNQSASARVDPNAIQEWQPKKQIIINLHDEVTTLKAEFGPAVSADDRQRIDDIEEEIGACSHKISKVPKWNESTDFRYRRHARVPKPTTKAVMFCEMDVSGSMDQETKDKAKIFYFLLYDFLKRFYEQTEVVFIRHHTTAEEVNEQDFFYKRESGGTMVSSGHELMLDIMEQRFPESEWNIYIAQASDGDNFDNDNAKTEDLMRQILPKVQGFFYTEITTGSHQALWDMYENLQPEFSDRFWIGQIQERQDIFKVFREFFQKKDATGSAPKSQAAAFEPGL